MLHEEHEMLSFEDVRVPCNAVECSTETEVSYHRLLQELHKLYPQVLPVHAVWGLGRQLWDPSSRVEGRRPVNIIVLGPTKEAMTTLSKELSQAFQIPLFTLPELMQDDLKGTLSITKVAFYCFQEVETLEELSDDDIVEALARQFDCKECCARGWILSGFPCTKAQQTAMETRGIIPDKVIILNTSLSESHEPEANEKHVQNISTDQPLSMSHCMAFTTLLSFQRKMV